MKHKENKSKLRGVLHLSQGSKNYQLLRAFPSLNLKHFVEQYWAVTWDLRGKAPHLQKNLPDPCINLVFEKKSSRIFGPVSGLFSRELSEQGEIFAVKFHPGGFLPFSQVPISKFTNQSLALGEVFFFNRPNLEPQILGAGSFEDRIKIIENYLLHIAAKKDGQITKITHIIDTIKNNHNITTVEELGDIFNLKTRTLQRLFRKYVGMPPKWVIKKYRLQEVISQMESGQANWQDLIFTLGYFDQAHFIKEFYSMIGKTPHEYFKNSLP